MRLVNVSALSFDLDDTLWPFQPAVEHAEMALHSWLVGRAPKTRRILRTWRNLAELRDDYERSRPDLVGNFRALRIGSIELALKLAEEDVTLVEEAYDVFYSTRQKVDFYEDVWPALTWLSTRFPLVAVTNGNADLRLTGGAEFFRDAFSARALGIAKPEAGIFHAAAKGAGVSAAELLHVGDDFHLDFLGALNAGLQAVWLIRENHLEGKHLGHSACRPHLSIHNLSVLCRALGGPAHLA